MRYSILISIILLNIFILSSCNSVEKITDANEIIKKEIVFFTDENNVRNETSYYDAVIELKRRFPEELKEMKIVSKKNEDENKFSKYNETYPAIVMIDQNQVVLKIVGYTDTEDIVIPISNTIEKW
ncbi:hypothetical protein JOC86_003221 [Bacillus pakistanensis]|uniref:Small peptidoglycan-associated lipoprotein n=1 Tax=Rossellomorea pakistanensis TaxID=992288 RepID=A0ABS2NFY9_9BACI|nr:hypothetical protein [Bacillus pakistanensis]MBM7586669.1 hypothetical protein [Bacillus pakistanensis]